MSKPAEDRRTPAQQRLDVRWTYANGLLWALGNGLVSTTLVVYLALDLGATSVAIAWIVAAPRFAGVLRVAAPALLAVGQRIGCGRKAICLTGFAGSTLVLMLIPIATWGLKGTGGVASAEVTAAGATYAGRIAVLVFAWCVYHLLEYIAVVALWSWIGDLYPQEARSRLLGFRERCLSLGRLIGIGASIALAMAWAWLSPDEAARVPLTISAAVGAVLMLAALVPLALTTAMAAQPSATPNAPWTTLRRALRERPYRKLLAFNCWLSFANGLTGAAQGMYPRNVLGLSYQELQPLRVAMWSGQAMIAPSAGGWIQRFGAGRVLMLAQLIVATGPLCFWIATPDAPWWVAVAFVAWIAYAPINVGLDTLKLNLGDPENNAPYVAVFHAIGDFCNGVTILLGGLLYEVLSTGDQRSLEIYAWLFLTGWVLRVLAAPLAARLIDTPKRDEST